MGDTGTECDSVRARARRTTMRSSRVRGGERVRFQYVGHCIETGSCTVVQNIVHVQRFHLVSSSCCLFLLLQDAEREYK